MADRRPIGLSSRALAADRNALSPLGISNIANCDGAVSRRIRAVADCDCSSIRRLRSVAKCQ